jgi:Domain of unknown function (DUF4382)
MAYLRRLLLPAVLVATGLAAGCSVKTTVEATSSTAPNVADFYVTVTGLAFNASATARAGDPGWVQVTLTDPVTVDLVDPSRALPTLVSAASMPGGTYRQMRLFLAGRDAALTPSATALGLKYNTQATYTDALGATYTVPVEFAVPSPSLALATNLVLAPGAGALTSSDSSQPTEVTLDTVFDAIRHLHFVSYGTQSAGLYSGPATAYDATTVGGIRGTVDLSGVGSGVRSGAQGIVATAEQLSADGSRQVAVGSAAVQSDGSFLIYPLPAGSAATQYDVVVHGPGIEPMIVRSVPVVTGLPGAATTVSTTALVPVLAPTYPVNTGSITTSAAGLVTTAGSSSNYTLPAGAEVDFYQTLWFSSAPYLIDSAALNPFTRQFDADWTLSAGNVDVGTYNAGGAITFTSRAPVQGQGGYLVATRAPLRAAGLLDTRVVAPQRAQTVTILPSPPLTASGSIRGLLPVSLSQATAGRYDTGLLVVSSGGVIVDTVDLTAAFAAAAPGATFAVGVVGLPIGTPAAPYLPAQYDVVARVWNSRSPASTLTFASLSTTLDLSAQVPTGVVLALP